MFLSYALHIYPGEETGIYSCLNRLQMTLVTRYCEFSLGFSTKKQIYARSLYSTYLLIYSTLLY